jgi:hypothetical protein
LNIFFYTGFVLSAAERRRIALLAVRAREKKRKQAKTYHVQRWLDQIGRGSLSRNTLMHIKSVVSGTGPAAVTLDAPILGAIWVMLFEEKCRKISANRAALP